MECGVDEICAIALIKKQWLKHDPVMYFTGLIVTLYITCSTVSFNKIGEDIHPCEQWGIKLYRY